MIKYEIMGTFAPDSYCGEAEITLRGEKLKHDKDDGASYVKGVSPCTILIDTEDLAAVFEFEGARAEDRAREMYELLKYAKVDLYV